MKEHSKASIARVVLMLALLAVLAGCAPAYNWREVRPEAAPVAVMLPGKPASMSREIDLAGLKVTMNMVGAKVDEHSFTIAWIVLPPHAQASESGTDTAKEPANDPAADRAAERATERSASIPAAIDPLTAMREGMVRNIAGKVTLERERSVPVLDAAGREKGLLSAREIVVEGRYRDRAVWMHGLFAQHDGRAYQFVALGPEPDAEQEAVFLDSVRLFADPARG